MEEHTIEINPQGQTTITVKGVKGKSCQDVTRKLEEALGQTASDQRTSEFYEQPLVKSKNQQ